LTRATREIQLLAALAPLEAPAERLRLVQEFRAGRPAVPRWSYKPVAHDELRGVLDVAQRELSAAAGSDPLVALHVERIRELSLEAELCAAAGSPKVAGLARARFAPRAPGCAEAASRLAAEWLVGAVPVDHAPRVPSDAPDPRSLLMRMREEVGRRRLPFAVVVQPSLAPLAATGDRVILVAAGRPVSEAEVARTVVHEIEGHVLPRVRASRASLPLLQVGTARGIDDQEGLALVLESRGGWLEARRRRTLAARHRAVEAMLSGASFADVTATLVGDHGFDAGEAVLVAERAFRGGNGVSPGLGRERVYLESFVRVRERLEQHPEDEAVLAAGQVALEAVEVLAPLVSRSL
jgi:hypothetical protein